MELGFAVAVGLVVLTLGVVLGIRIERSRMKKEGVQGVIYAYYGESDIRPALLLEYGVPIDDIASRKRVVFDVEVIREDSQK